MWGWGCREDQKIKNLNGSSRQYPLFDTKNSHKYTNFVRNVQTLAPQGCQTVTENLFRKGGCSLAETKDPFGWEVPLYCRFAQSIVPGIMS